MPAYHISFEGGNAPSFQQLYDYCVDLGLATTEDGRTDVAEEYRVDGNQRRNKDIETALAELAGAEHGGLHFWEETGLDLNIQLRAHPETDDSELQGSASIGFATKWLDTKAWPEETISERLEMVLSLVEEMVLLVAPEFVWSGILDEVIIEARKPSGQPISDTISELGWITVISEHNLEQFGGREHVLATPAWRLDELESGHVMLVLGENPFDPDPERKGYERLLNR